MKNEVIPEGKNEAELINRKTTEIFPEGLNKWERPFSKKPTKKKVSWLSCLENWERPFK